MRRKVQSTMCEIPLPSLDKRGARGDLGCEVRVLYSLDLRRISPWG